MNNQDQIFSLIKEEKKTARWTRTIASENFTSDNVMKAAGSILTKQICRSYPENILWWVRSCGLGEAVAIMGKLLFLVNMQMCTSFRFWAIQQYLTHRDQEMNSGS